MKSKKYSRYQDYVIRDGELVGDFERMYQDFDDPWGQLEHEKNATEKKIILDHLSRLRPKTVLEVGSGLGFFTNEISRSCNARVVGVEVSPTAVEKARVNYQSVMFECGDILSFDIYRKYQPDVIVMSEVTWYVLDKLERFKDFLRLDSPDIILMHSLTMYDKETQKLGKEFFTNLKELLNFFDMNYLEYGLIVKERPSKSQRSYFIGSYSELSVK